MHADVVVWATPIYYYEMSGQMKTLIDRMNAMYSMDYKFREVYLLTSATEEGRVSSKSSRIWFDGVDRVLSKIKVSRNFVFAVVLMSLMRFLEMKNCRKHLNWVSLCEYFLWRKLDLMQFSK